MVLLMTRDEKRGRAKELGLCAQCLHPNPTATLGFSRCKRCRDQINYNKRNIRRARVAVGLCTVCASPVQTGRKRCHECLMVDKAKRDAKNGNH